MGKCESSSKSRYYEYETTSRHTHKHHRSKGSEVTEERTEEPKKAPEYGKGEINLKAEDIITKLGINLEDVAAKLGVNLQDIFTALGINVEDVAITNRSLVNSLNTVQFFIVALNVADNAVAANLQQGNTGTTGSASAQIVEPVNGQGA